MNRPRTVAVTGGATALLLFAFVVARVIADLPLLAMASSSVFAEAVLVIEAVTLSVVLALAVAAALIARRSWLAKARSPWPGFVVFSIVCALSIFTTSRGLGPVAVVGWVAIILSGAALMAQTSTMWE